MTSRALGFDHDCSIRHEFPPEEQTANPIERVVGYPINCLATIAAAGASCLGGQYGNRQRPAMDETLEFFIPSSLHSTFQLCESQPGGEFSDQLKADFSVSYNQVCGVSNSKILPSRYSRQTRTLSIACIVWVPLAVLWGGNSCLALRFSLNNWYLWSATLFTNMGYFCSNSF